MQLVILLLAGASASRRRALERRLASGGPDPLLDEEGLGAQLLAARSLSAPSAPLFFYVVVRHALRDAGIDDAHLADYLGASFGTTFASATRIGTSRRTGIVPITASASRNRRVSAVG